MSKVKIREFDSQIYPVKLWIAIGRDDEFYSEQFEDVAEWPDTCDAIEQYLYNKQTDRTGVLIRFESKARMTTKVNAHEATHAAMDIFHAIRESICYDCQEPFAYLVGWIADCIDKARLNKE